MRLWVGVTDKDWFDYLRAISPDEVNFWQPSAGQGFRAIEPGAPFLFKLHSPNNFIVGGGFFVRYTILPLSIAWEAFTTKNGAPDQHTMAARISKYRRDTDVGPDPQVGCIILTQPFFFERHQWIPVPQDWKPNIVRGKTYDTSQPVGADLWALVQERFTDLTPAGVGIAETAAPYGSEYLARARLGQGAFRVLVTDAYNRRCAITGERTLPVLEAAHIKPFAKSGPHRTRNGLLLRSDLHTLFDLGYLTVTHDHRVEVSKRIREQYENGRDYYALHGRRLSVLPEVGGDRPGREFLDWHHQNVFAA